MGLDKSGLGPGGAGGKKGETQAAETGATEDRRRSATSGHTQTWWSTRITLPPITLVISSSA